MARLSRKTVEDAKNNARKEKMQAEDPADGRDHASTQNTLQRQRSLDHSDSSAALLRSSAATENLEGEIDAQESEAGDKKSRGEESQGEEGDDEDDENDDEEDNEDTGEEDNEGDDSDYSDMSDFIVDDSASDDELRRGNTRSPRKSPRKLVRGSPERKRAPTTISIFNDDSEDEVKILTAVDNKATARLSPRKLRAAGSDSEGSDKENAGDATDKTGASGEIPYGDSKKPDDAGIMKRLADQLGSVLRLSPPRSERKTGWADGQISGATTPSRATPPESPSRRLKSPTRKNLANIPKSPHRQSVDAFWNQDSVDTWNERHSPKKAPRRKNRLLPIFLSPTKVKSPRRLILDSDDEFFSSGTEDTTKRGPWKDDAGLDGDFRSNKIPDRQLTSPKKAFKRAPEPENQSHSPYSIATDADRNRFKKTGRYALAREYLDELVSRVSVASIGDGTRTRLDQFLEKSGDESAGGSGISNSEKGIPIKWSKTLLKTAGRATLRTKTTKNKNGTVTKTAIMWIELAERVLDRPEYVMNTLAHEFAHLCNMIKDPRAPAHGAGFFDWARRIERAIQKRALPPAMDHLGVEVHITTRHNYDIDFKYVWACMECGKQIGRHSKSLAKGSYHKPDGGMFHLIKPKPRAGGESPAKESAWQVFRKKNFNAVKQELSDSKGRKVQLAEVMAVLSERWKQNKTTETGPPVKLSGATEDVKTWGVGLPVVDDGLAIAGDGEDEIDEVQLAEDEVDV